MKNRPTIALSMIVKDEFDEVSEIISQAINYFNEINIVVSDKGTADRLKAVAKPFVGHYNGPIVRIKHRKWNDRFDEARNASLNMCTTDFVFWVDSDDQFDFSNIPELLSIADKNNIDAIFLPYVYARDDEGNIITLHWRERLLRRSKGFEWRGWVHETCITDDKYTSHKVNVPVYHNTTQEHAKDSSGRNHLILEKAYAETKDPRYLHYLGMSYFTKEDYTKCVETLSKYLEVGGSVEDVYRSLSIISEAAYHMKKFDIAMEYASKAATLKPSYPMAYWLLAQYEADQENWEEALEWVHVSESKPDPDTLTVWDPSARERAVLIAAQAEFMLGNYNAALAELRKIPKNSSAKELYDGFKQEADAETFTNLLPELTKYFASTKALWDSLCDDMKYDSRLRSLRFSVTKPRVWDDKSIVIFCGQGYEEWGPHTLDKGMGGSEEAVVYLSRELVSLGYDVTVFGEASGYDAFSRGEWLSEPTSMDVRLYSGGHTPAVHYCHWKEIDTRDEFNIFISWRAPAYLERVNAKVKLADIHDVLPADLAKDYPDVTYMFKSKFHKGLYPDLPEDKSKVVGNGIKKDQFKETK